MLAFKLSEETAYRARRMTMNGKQEPEELRVLDDAEIDALV
jgi:hypothetical protein